jgi:hypothetical protein
MDAGDRGAVKRLLMELFISHAQVDIEVAHALRLRLDELSEELDCFLLADAVFAGDNWEERIRAAAKSCDAILCLATPDYVERPWFAAEWALFWFQEKPWYLALHDVALETVFKPLHGRQAVRLDERRSVERLMRSLIEHGGLLSTAAPDLLADETVTAIREATRRSRLAHAESDLATFAVSLRRGTDNVDAELVERLVSIGRLNEMMEQASAVDNWVALRQFAVCLLQLSEFDAAAQLADRVENRAERRTIGIAALDVLSREQSNHHATELVHAIYTSVREPQRRELRTAGELRGLDIDWPDVAPSL